MSMVLVMSNLMTKRKAGKRRVGQSQNPSSDAFNLVTVFRAVTFRRESVQLPIIPPITLAMSSLLQLAHGGFMIVLRRRL